MLTQCQSSVLAFGEQTCLVDRCHEETQGRGDVRSGIVKLSPEESAM